MKISLARYGAGDALEVAETPVNVYLQVGQVLGLGYCFNIVLEVSHSFEELGITHLGVESALKYLTRCRDRFDTESVPNGKVGSSVLTRDSIESIEPKSRPSRRSLRAALAVRSRALAYARSFWQLEAGRLWMVRKQWLLRQGPELEVLDLIEHHRALFNRIQSSPCLSQFLLTVICLESARTAMLRKRQLAVEKLSRAVRLRACVSVGSQDVPRPSWGCQPCFAPVQQRSKFLR